MYIATLLTDVVGIWRHRTPLHETGFPDVADAPPDTRRLIRNRRYCQVLSKRNDMPLDNISIRCAWKAVRHEMALVPGGEVQRMRDVITSSGVGIELISIRDQAANVNSFYLDRDCVTNADFARFVQDTGYGCADHWPESVLPNVLQFVDKTGQPGPKFWSNSKPPANKQDHPVVGISWYEANAYATWAGKRLPSSDEWQRAGTWPHAHTGDGNQWRYPWGNSFDPAKANLWASGCGGTVPVRAFEGGSMPNGVRQLIGNVWEWGDTQFFPEGEDGVSMLDTQTMAEIRGGAFDTYFPTQASCQFRTGQPLLYRGASVGFRCCVGIEELSDALDSAATF